MVECFHRMFVAHDATSSEEQLICLDNFFVCLVGKILCGDVLYKQLKMAPLQLSNFVLYVRKIGERGRERL